MTTETVSICNRNEDGTLTVQSVERMEVKTGFPYPVPTAEYQGRVQVLSDNRILGLVIINETPQ